MKSNQKTKTIILIILGIISAFSPILITSFSFITGNSNKSSEYSDDFTLDEDNLKISGVSGPIYIDDNNPSSNWSVAKSVGICTGNGTNSEPYVIKDLEIDGNGTGICILIENSDVNFKIENCSLNNWGSYPIFLSNVTNALLIDNEWKGHWGSKGILLSNVNNSQIIDNNDCDGLIIRNSNNNTISGNDMRDGIYLNNSNYNEIVDNSYSDSWSWIVLTESNYNTITRNDIVSSFGIYLKDCDYNEIMENSFTSTWEGISLEDSDYNNIRRNSILSVYLGIHLVRSDYNEVIGNSLHKRELGEFGTSYDCVIQEYCVGNTFSGNTCDEIIILIPWEIWEIIRNILMVLVTLGIILIVITIIYFKKIKKRN